MSDLFSGNRAVQEQSRLLFRCILMSRTVTRPMALSQLNLPPTSLNRALDRLMAAGLIEDAGQAESTGGRPASRFRIRRDARLMLGISISGTSQTSRTVRLALLDLALEPVAQLEMAWQPDTLAETILAAITGLLANAGPNGPAPDRRANSQQAGTERPTGGECLIGTERLIGIGIDGADLLPESDRQALVSRLASQFACQVFCGDGLTGAAYLLARTSGVGTGSVGLLSLDAPIAIIPADRPTGPDLDHAGHSVAAFPVLDLLGDREPFLRPLASILGMEAIGQRFAVLRDQPSLGFEDFYLACQQEKKKAMRLLESAAHALAQAAMGIACVSGLDDIVVSGALAEAVPPLVPAAAARIARLGHTFGVPVQLRPQPYGSGLRAAGIAARVLARALETPIAEQPKD